jgi:hypothetical protein
MIAYPQFNLKQNVRFVATHPYAGWQGRVISLQLTGDGFVYGVKLDSGTLTTMEANLEADDGTPVPSPTNTLAAHEAAAQRRALTRIRASVIAAVQDAMTFESAAADTLWAALRTLDAECVAAGLATCFDASGLAVAR